jgi:hypothetical protein
MERSDGLERGNKESCVRGHQAPFTPTKAFSCLRASSRSSRYSRNFAQAMRQVATLDIPGRWLCIEAGYRLPVQSTSGILRVWNSSGQVVKDRVIFRALWGRLADTLKVSS